jgi:hypothetical protein
MPSKHRLPVRTGILALALCAILNAQLSMVSKFPAPRTNHTPTCLNCVRDVTGQISRNPAPVRAFRAKHPCPTTGSVTGACPGYVVDDKKALKPGASDTPENMRWRTIAQAAKDHAK